MPKAIGSVVCQCLSFLINFADWCRWIDRRSDTLTSKLLLVSGFKDLEAAHERLVNGHEGTRVVKFTAVVRCTEHCNELTLSKELVAVFDDLMCPTNQINVVLLHELLHGALAKYKTDTAIILTILLNTLLWVGPQEITQKASVRHLSRSNHLVDALKVVEIR